MPQAGGGRETPGNIAAPNRQSLARRTVVVWRPGVWPSPSLQVILDCCCNVLFTAELRALVRYPKELPLSNTKVVSGSVLAFQLPPSTSREMPRASEGTVWRHFGFPRKRRRTMAHAQHRSRTTRKLTCRRLARPCLFLPRLAKSQRVLKVSIKVLHAQIASEVMC